MDQKDILEAKSKKPHLGMRIVTLAIDYPKMITTIMTAITLVILAIAVAPNIWPTQLSSLHTLSVDTDPENMLPADEPNRAFHDQMKKVLSMHELIAVGVVNKKSPYGIYNPITLKKVYEIAKFAESVEGVISVDLMAPSSVDNIKQEGPGTIKFEWLMPEIPQNQEQVNVIKQKVDRLPFIKGTLFSADDKALGVYIPIVSKNMSSSIYAALNEKINEINADATNGDEFHIAGLPVAEDIFGVEMFKQMGISAPISMLFIFILMLLFFKKIKLIISPMIVAMVSVISTMGLLVITGHTVHIMSSMIPIFIMPIAVLDAVHILSDFFDRHHHSQDRRGTILKVMQHLFFPMLYTSLTTIAGFASLALTPNPPVQVFGTFVALGVGLAWIWTILFVPAYVMLLSPKTLQNFGRKVGLENVETTKFDLMGNILSSLKKITYYHAKAVIVASIALAGISYYGITKIVINDNPTRWFNDKHPIRVADREMNQHLAGTYMAYLTLQNNEEAKVDEAFLQKVKAKLNVDESISGKMLAEFIINAGKDSQRQEDFIRNLEGQINNVSQSASDSEREYWDSKLDSIDEYKLEGQTFKDPQILAYIEKLQAEMDKISTVGKTSSLADLVKTVQRELIDGRDENYVLPATRNGVGQAILNYQNGHRPQDLWHFVTPDFKTASIWVQLKSGDNVDMQEVVDKVNAFSKENEGAFKLKHRWFGLTYVNLIWQDQMVKGMLEAFLGSFVVVLIMMIVLFRSFVWGILSMIPLSLTILFIYGFIGLVGKDYDMPVAVLSSLSLGLAVDYAIHFLSRAREIHANKPNWKDALEEIFEEPARAIMRNIIVVGVGFTPLILSPLMPYRTVGFLIAAILLSAGFITLLLLPAIITLLQGYLFRPQPSLEDKGNVKPGGVTMTSIIIALGLLLSQNQAQAEEKLSVQSIIEKTNAIAYYEGKDGVAHVNMEIKDSQGRIRDREFVILRKNLVVGGDQKFYVYFKRPSDVKKMSFLVWKKGEGDDDRWLYVPALDLVKRIASSDKRTSFAGSDFYYEDVSGRGIKNDNYVLESSNDKFYTVKGTPKRPDEVEFSYYLIHIHKSSFLPIKIEYFDKNKKSYREYQALKIEMIERHATVTKASMQDKRTGSTTTNTMSRIKYDIGISENIFSERYLRNAPMEYLK